MRIISREREITTSREEMEKVGVRGALWDVGSDLKPCVKWDLFTRCRV